jgi:hypothetical protein
MRALILAAGAALALSACGGNNDTAANEDLNATDNMALDQNLAGTPGGMDSNLATNATTENMMMNDLTTNDADTNLANGM